MSNRLNPYKSLYALFLTALLAFSCVSGEKEAPDLPEMVEVDLQVGVDDASQPVLTKASDTRALPGEQIHSLVVFIVNSSGTVEKKFEPNLTTNSDAQKGELESWKSGTFTLTKGVKQIYAFANWESLGNNDLNNAIVTAEGEPMPTFPETVAYPAAGFAPASGTYLPMSCTETWTVSSGKKTIKLIRLVSRLKVEVTNATTHSVQLDHLQIAVQQGTTSLFEESPIAESTLTGVSFLPTDETKTLVAMHDGTLDKYESGWIYVFESNTDDKGYKIVFRTTSGNNSGHGSDLHGGERSTINKIIKRNHIWNLALWISGYKLNLKLTGDNPPIGGYPSVTTDAEGASFTLYGGGPFSIAIGELTSNESTNVPTITGWKVSGFTSGSELLVGKTEADKLTIDNVAKTITGRMVGAAKKDASVTFKLEAISNGQTVSIFPITLKFAEIFDQKNTQP